MKQSVQKILILTGFIITCSLAAQNCEELEKDSSVTVQSVESVGKRKPKPEMVQGPKETAQETEVIEKEVILPSKTKHKKVAQQKKTTKKKNIQVTSNKPVEKSIVQPVETPKPCLLEQKQVVQASEEARTIILTDNLEREDFGYSHWTGRYYPSKFILTVDGKTILTFDGKNFERPIKEIPAPADCILKARFDWEFTVAGKVVRKGWRELDFKIKPDACKLALDFDWKHEASQLIVDNATLLASREVK